MILARKTTRTWLACAAASVLWALPAAADSDPKAAETSKEGTSKPEAPKQDSSKPEAPKEDASKPKASKSAWILDMIALPKAADEARKSGMPDAEVQEVVDLVKAGEGDASAANEALGHCARVAKEGGDTENFGKFVRQQVKEGKRGAELTAVIQPEKARRIAEKRERKDKERAEAGTRAGGHKGSDEGLGQGRPASRGSSMSPTGRAVAPSSEPALDRAGKSKKDAKDQAAAQGHRTRDEAVRGGSVPKTEADRPSRPEASPSGASNSSSKKSGSKAVHEPGAKTGDGKGGGKGDGTGAGDGKGRGSSKGGK